MNADAAARVVALFEATKGIVVLLAGFGLLTVVHQDLQAVAEELVRTFHLNPAKQIPRIFLEAADRFSDVRLWTLAALALGYAALRLAEAYGLWFGHRWAEWFAVASGAIYIAPELYGIWHHISWIRVGVLALNIGVVAYIGRALWQRRRQRLSGS